MALEKTRAEKIKDKFSLYDADDKRFFNFYFMGYVLAFVALGLCVISLFTPFMRYDEITTLSGGNKSVIDTPVSFFRGSYTTFLIVINVVVCLFFSIKKKIKHYFISSLVLTVLTVVTMLLSKHYVSVKVTQAVTGEGFSTIGSNAHFGFGFILIIVSLAIVLVSCFFQKIGDDRRQKFEEDKLRKRAEELTRKREELRKKKESSVVIVKK